MKADRVTLILLAAALACVAYVLYLQQRQLVELESDLDRFRGSVGETVAPPVPPAGDGVVTGGD